MILSSVFNSTMDFIIKGMVIDNTSQTSLVEKSIKKIVEFDENNAHFERWKIIKQINMHLFDENICKKYFKSESYKHRSFFSEVEHAFEDAIKNIKFCENVESRDLDSDLNNFSEQLGEDNFDSQETLNIPESSNRLTDFSVKENSLTEENAQYINNFDIEKSKTDKFYIENLDSYSDKLTPEEEKGLIGIFFSQEKKRFNQITLFADKLASIFGDKMYLKKVFSFIEDLEAELTTYKITDIHSNKYRAISEKHYFGVVLRVFFDIFNAYHPSPKDLSIQIIENNSNMRQFVYSVEAILDLIDKFIEKGTGFLNRNK